MIFWNFTLTYIMKIIIECKSVKKLKCFQIEIISKIKLLIIRNICFMVLLIVSHNLSKNVKINRLK